MENENLAPIPSGQLSPEEVENELRRLKIRFRDELADIANKCDTPIIVRLIPLPNGGLFNPHKQGTPFDVKVEKSEYRMNVGYTFNPEKRGKQLLPEEYR